MRYKIMVGDNQLYGLLGCVTVVLYIGHPEIICNVFSKTTQQQDNLHKYHSPVGIKLINMLSPTLDKLLHGLRKKLFYWATRQECTTSLTVWSVMNCRSLTAFFFWKIKKREGNEGRPVEGGLGWMLDALKPQTSVAAQLHHSYHWVWVRAVMRNNTCIQ
jgi:hypothetical protein